MRTAPRFFASLLLASVVGAAGCGNDLGPASVDGGTDGDVIDGSQPDYAPGPRSNYTEEEAADARAACTFKKGDKPAVSLAKDALLGDDIPIDHIIVVMMENRSFDHLLAELPSMGVDAEVADASHTNLDAMGEEVAFHHLEDMCFEDTNHEWGGVHKQFNDGAMDGFVVTNDTWSGATDGGKRAMGYYGKDDLPFLYGLAANYAISDRYFCSVLGPTFPNREYLYAATSFGHTENDLFQKPMPTLFEAMDAGGVTWAEYFFTLPGTGVFLNTYTSPEHRDNYRQFDEFQMDLDSGTLPQVVFLDPDLASERGKGNDFHPPGDAQVGEQFLEEVVKAVTASAIWPRTALLITWDEHGGLYDHVAPPSACPPDDLKPTPGDPDYPDARFDRLGIRVPLIVVSPWAKKQYVSHHVYDHTSITRFIEARYSLPALTGRDANAEPLTDLFDFSAPQLLTPPALPASVVDEDQYKLCKRKFPPGG